MFIKHEHLLMSYGLMGKLKITNSSTIKYYKGYYSKIKSLKILLLVLLMYVWVPCMWRYLWSLEEHVRFPGAGVI